MSDSVAAAGLHTQGKGHAAPPHEGPPPLEAEALQQLYARRFSEAERKDKARLWGVFIDAFLQRYIAPTDTIADLGGGYCEFINAVRAGKKYVVDSSEAMLKHAGADVEAHDALTALPERSCHVVFASNVFEHLTGLAELMMTLQEIRRVLKPGGRLLILQPNIKYAYREYWDFIDHHLPLSHAGLQEALAISGFRTTVCLPRFLPFSIKSRLPKTTWLIRWYVRLPWVWRLLGKQMFLVAERLP